MPFQNYKLSIILLATMFQEKYHQSSLSTLRYPNYMSQSLARLELRKPLFLCGGSRVQDYTKNYQRSHRDFSDYSVNKLSEQSRRKLQRIQGNPFLKSYRIYPKIQVCGLSPKLQKIQIHQKQQYITKRQESFYRRLPTFGDQSPQKNQYRQQYYNDEAEKYAADIFRRQMDLKGKNEKSSPVREEFRSKSRHLTDYEKVDRNMYQRYQTQNPQEQFYSHANHNKAYDQEHYLTNLFPTSLNRQQNQTIIHNLQDHTINQDSEIERFIGKDKNYENGQRNTGTFGSSPINQKDIFGVIQRINEQGQSRRQKYKSKETCPDEINVRGTTYYSVKLK